MYFRKYNHVCAYVCLYTCFYFTLCTDGYRQVYYCTYTLFIEILMSVVMLFVPKHVQTLMEACTNTDVILVINWTLMGLLVMVSTNMCAVVIINLHIHIHTNVYAYLLVKHIICMYIYKLKYSYIQNMNTFIEDVDECNVGTHNCSQTCTSTNGSFSCGCYNGYLLDIDKATCNSMYKK